MQVVFYIMLVSWEQLVKNQRILMNLKNQLILLKNIQILPIVPGFGIKNEVDVNNICKIADGAVVGSSIIKIVEENLDDKEI